MALKTPKRRSQPTEHDSDYSKVVFSWIFPEFEKPQRGRLWYIITTLLGIFLVVYSIKEFNFLLLVIVILIVFILYLYHIKEVEDIDFKIVDTGIVVDNKFFMWKALKSFYIIYEPPKVKHLYFSFSSITRPILTVPLENQNPLKIREYLLEYLIEDIEKEREPLGQLIGRDLKL